ncbi:MAG: phenylalanine--tRNA ligase subunit beta, partial [Candidatus Aenigmatarchaeota archaeon]
MPVVDILRWDLERLVGEKLDNNVIMDMLPRLKLEIESIENDVIEFEATHDRPDLYSVEGVARGLKGLLEKELGIPRYEFFDSRIIGYNEGPSYRPYIGLAIVRGVDFDDESIRQVMQLQEKLHTTFGRDRRKISIGLYDLSKIKPPVYYRHVDPDEVKFVPLEFAEELSLREILKYHPKGVEYGWIIANYDTYPLLVDSEGTVLSMPPIVNSEDTKVTEETRDVIIDTTATDLMAGLKALTIVTLALAERGGKVGMVKVIGKNGELITPLRDNEEFFLDVSLVERLSGLRVTVEETANLLRRMRFDVEIGDRLRVLVPPYRVDILHPVDLVEEVVMAYGYDNIDPIVMRPLHPGREDGLEVFTRIVRNRMIGLGFIEVNNYMMTNPELLYDKMRLSRMPTVVVENPKQENYTCLRTWLTPLLMQVLSRSKHVEYPQRIFETGDVVIIDERSENMTREERRLAFAIAGDGITFTDGHAVLDAFLRSFKLDYTLESITHESFIDGRYAKVIVDGKEVGFIG